MKPNLPPPVVEVIAFGHNRGNVLAPFVNDLHHYLTDNLPAVWLLTIADNGSTDDTWSTATRLAATLPSTRAARLDERMGRRELRFEWSHSRALVAAFVEVRPDVDLDRVLAPLIASSGRHSPIQSTTTRGLTRRQALGAIGTVGLGAFLAACSRAATTTSTITTISGTTIPGATAATGTTTAATTVASATPTVATVGAEIDCVLVPEMTEGPYYLDLDLVRSDITEDRVGATLALTIMVASVEGCSAIQDAAVDLWHCDAEGIYSGFVAASTGGGGDTDDSIFLRGTQLTDGGGQVKFQTLYPGWYRGRTVHVHMKVHVGGSQIHTTQLFFDDAFTDQVYGAHEPYASRNNRDALNSNDGIYGGGGEATRLSVVEAGEGYAATLVVGVEA